MPETSKPSIATPVRPRRKRRRKASTRPRKLPPYNVVLLDDDEHTYGYVIEMLVALFGFDRTKAFLKAREVDTQGRVILLTTSKEHAELKRDQIHAYGRDTRIASCRGSMTALIEPASA